MLRHLGRHLPVLIAGLAVLTLAQPAAAQTWSRDRVQSPAYQNGYQEGLRHGEADARSGRRFQYDRAGTYRDADRGYNSRFGRRDEYRRVFQQGYASGYNDGYYGRAQYGPGRRAVPRSPGAYRSFPYAYPDRGRSGRFGYDVAFDNGFADGYEKGFEDWRDRDRYDPLRHRRYRSADRGYDRRYGSKGQYQNAYRDGFRVGYEQAYREAARYGNRRDGWNGPWPR
jgi:hypothetical protein